MSKQQIMDVCTLAAHLAQRQPLRVNLGELPATALFDFSGNRCASDAMRLQKLGRRARNNETKRCNVPDYYSEENHGCKYNGEQARMSALLREILAPYRLKGSVGGDPRGYCLHILGLPGNTLGGDEDGFGI